MPKIGFHRASALVLGGLTLANFCLAESLSTSPGALMLAALGAMLLVRRPMLQST